MREGEEGADGVDIDEDEVILVVGGNTGLSNNGALIQIVPVLISVELVHSDHFLGHVSSYVEFLRSLTAIFLQLVKSLVSSHHHISIAVNSDHVFIGAQSDADDKGVDQNWIVDLSIGGRVIAVSESHKGVDLGLLGLLVPRGADEEGSYLVAVDSEEKVLERRVDAGLIEGVSSAEVIPEKSLELTIDCRPDVKKSHTGLSVGDGHVGKEYSASLGGGIRNHRGKAQSKQDEGDQFVHILFI